MTTIANKKIGRFDDLTVFFGTHLEQDAIRFWVDAMKAGNFLAFKWCNIKKASKIRNYLGMSPKEFRKFIVDGRKGILESVMTEKRWAEIEYSHVPSVAMSRYTKAFQKNDTARFTAWAANTTDVKAGALYPYDVLRALEANPANEDVARKQWETIKLDIDASILPIIDTSGSMSGARAAGKLTCMDVAVSLGVFIAMRNKGAFNNMFINFSEMPTVQKIDPNKPLRDTFNQVKFTDWGGSTNFTAAYELILNHAIHSKATKDQMPKFILVLSDMQFNHAVRGGTAFEQMRDKFNKAGYDLPTIVFWNLNAAYGNYPSSSVMKDVAMVSGFSPAILKTIVSGNVPIITPKSIMEETIKPYLDLIA